MIAYPLTKGLPSKACNGHIEKRGIIFVHMEALTKGLPSKAFNGHIEKRGIIFVHMEVETQKIIINKAYLFYESALKMNGSRINSYDLLIPVHQKCTSIQGKKKKKIYIYIYIYILVKYSQTRLKCN